MKLRILSDLHLEHNYFEYSYCGEDVVILAGDISTASNHDIFKYFIKDIPNTVKIIFIAGNHEFYHGIVSEEKSFYRSIEKEYTNFKFLDKQHFEINHDNKHYTFFGGTMCSDLNLYNNIESAGKEARSFINDFYLTKTNERTKWTVDDHLKEYKFFNKTFNKWVNSIFFDGDKIINPIKVCISHFLPSEKSIDMKFYQDRLNPYFCSNQEKRVNKVDYWIHGHTHSSFEYIIKYTRVICNPLGYGRENKKFDKDLVIDI